MTNVLKMIYINDQSGNKNTWTLKDPKSNLTKTTVATAMMDILAEEIVGNNKGEVCDLIEDAYIYQTEKIELS